MSSTEKFTNKGNQSENEIEQTVGSQLSGSNKKIANGAHKRNKAKLQVNNFLGDIDQLAKGNGEQMTSEQAREEQQEYIN